MTIYLPSVCALVLLEPLLLLAGGPSLQLKVSLMSACAVALALESDENQRSNARDEVQGQVHAIANDCAR